MSAPRVPLLERLVGLINFDDPNGCWLWTGTVANTGYGRMKVRMTDNKYRWLSAHRVSYEQFVGPIPDGLVIDHLCRVKTCVNPDHLEPVSQRINIVRGDAPQGINARKTHCIHGHEFTTANTRLRVRSGAVGRACRACDAMRSAAS